MFSRWGKIKTQVIESNVDAKGREQKGPKRMMNQKNRWQKAATCLLIHLFFDDSNQDMLFCHTWQIHAICELILWHMTNPRRISSKSITICRSSGVSSKSKQLRGCSCSSGASFTETFTGCLQASDASDRTGAKGHAKGHGHHGPQPLGCHHDYSVSESIPSWNLEYFEHVRRKKHFRFTGFWSLWISGQDSNFWQHSGTWTIASQCSTSVDMSSKKTLQELKEEKERSAELAKVVKMLDNQWVGVTADKEWSIAMQCTLGKKCLAWLLQCNALWGLRCLSYQGYTWKSSTIWHAWALFVRPVEDSSGADLFFAMKHGKIQSQETTISSQLTLTCSLLKGCLENKYPAKSHFPGLDHLLLICQWLCSRLSKLNVRWITVSFDLHTSALWIVLWVLNWMKCCIPPKSCQVTLLYDTTRLFLWIWGKKALAVTYQVSVS